MPRRTFALVTLLAVTHAHAQPNASAEADVLFDRARTLLEQKKIAEACTTFDASQRVAPALTTQINQADCRETNKQFATAYGLWRDVERQTRAGLDEMMKKTNRYARDRVKKLEPRLSKLQLDMASTDRVAGLEITRNGAPFDVILLGQPLPADGGTYTITARATGYEEWSTTFEMAPERDSKTVLIPPLVRLPPSVAAAARPSSVGVLSTPPSPPNKWLPYAVGGGAVLLVGAAVGLEFWARGQYADAQVEPDDFRQEDLWQGAKTKRFVAQGLAVAGLGTAGVAVWLYLRARSYEAPLVTPTVGDGAAGMVFTGSF